MNTTDIKIVDAVVGIHNKSQAWLSNEPAFSTKHQREAYVERYTQTDALLRTLQCSERRSAERALVLRDMRKFIASLPYQIF